MRGRSGRTLAGVDSSLDKRREEQDSVEYAEMAQPRAADDFGAIRARLEELRRERVDHHVDTEILGKPADPDRLLAQGHRGAVSANR